MVRILALILLCSVLVSADSEWWNNGVIYQIYPRSFSDSDNNGVGDIKGIISKAEYLKDLGIDAIWLSSLCTSDNKDFGYDCLDHGHIDPIFGTKDDFHNMVEMFHEMGIKIIVDFVPNHTSIKHRWFQSWLAGNDTFEKYYKIVKQDALPNNWVSVHGGSAWQNVTRKNETYYYLHQFLECEPDLDLTNRDVQAAMKDALETWLLHNVDGIFIQGSFALIEDKDLGNDLYDANLKFCNNDKDNYNCYTHEKTSDTKDTMTLLEDFQTAVSAGGWNSRIMLTETLSTNITVINKYYSVSTFPLNLFFIVDSMKPLNANYNITLLRAEDWVKDINEWTQYQQKDIKKSPPNWLLGTHEYSRVASVHGSAMIDLLNIMQMTLKGVSIPYYGQEIGMRNSLVRFHQARDTMGGELNQDTYYTKSRDFERGPMLWDDGRYAGFSNDHEPWLPLATDSWKVNLKNQNDTKTNSTHLNIFKQMTTLRSTYLLKNGNCDVSLVNKNKDVMAIYRSLIDNPTLIALFNMGSETHNVTLTEDRPTLPMSVYLYTWSTNIVHKDFKLGDAFYSSQNITLPPKGAMIFLTAALNTPLQVGKNATITLG